MPDSFRPKNWKFRGIATGTAVLAASQLYWIQELVYTRKEGEAQERRIDRLGQGIKEIRADVANIRQDVGVIKGILTAGTKKKPPLPQSQAQKAAEEAAAYWRVRYEELENER